MKFSRHFEWTTTTHPSKWVCKRTLLQGTGLIDSDLIPRLYRRNNACFHQYLHYPFIARYRGSCHRHRLQYHGTWRSWTRQLIKAATGSIIKNQKSSGKKKAGKFMFIMTFLKTRWLYCKAPFLFYFAHLHLFFFFNFLGTFFPRGCEVQQIVLYIKKKKKEKVPIRLCPLRPLLCYVVCLL